MPNAIPFSGQNRFVVPGSEKQSLRDDTRIPVRTGLGTPAAITLRGAASMGNSRQAKGILTVAVVVRSKKPLNLVSLGRRMVRMSRAEYAENHGPNPASLAAVKAFARAYHLRAKTPARGRRAVELTGTVDAMQEAFGVSLEAVRVGSRTYRTREGSISLPRALFDHVEAVLGLDNRPQVEPYFRCIADTMSPKATLSPLTVGSSKRSYSPPKVAEHYQFPLGTRADGQSIALLEFGGGFRVVDLKNFFGSLGQPLPRIVVVSVGGAKNVPTGDTTGPDSEVMLDIAVAASVAPGATIVIYFAPNTDKGFLDAIATAVHDTRNKPTVISISWGASESKWTGQSMRTLDDVCQAAAKLGISITAASGDHGSPDSINDGKNHVNFPASSPHVLSCGGTMLVARGDSIIDEIVWNEESYGATGGGVSDFFPLPQWQKAARVPKATSPTGGRGVPDVSGNAAISSGYSVIVDGRKLAIGGTSAVAPLWAALIALNNTLNRHGAGFINQELYEAAGRKALFRDILKGNNGAFNAESGWDACTGLGSPIGRAIIKMLGGSQAAIVTKAANKQGRVVPSNRRIRKAR